MRIRGKEHPAGAGHVRRFSSKRGQVWSEWLLNVLFNLIIISMVLWILIANIKDVAEGTYFDRVYYTKDIGLLTSAIVASPGAIEAYYVADLTGYRINFTNGTLALKDDNARFPNLHHYGYNSMLIIEDEPVEKTLAFSREGNLLRIGTDPLEDTINTIIFCNDLAATTLSGMKVVFDPGHTPSSPGFIHPSSPTLTEASMMTSLVQSIRTSVTSSGIDKEYTRILNKDITMEERLVKIGKGDIVVSLHAGTNPDEEIEEVVIYLPPPDDSSYHPSALLACHILENIVRSFPTITGVAIIPGDHPELRQDTDYAVLLELGNINHPYQGSVLQKTAPIAGAILRGLKDTFPEERTAR